MAACRTTRGHGGRAGRSERVCGESELSSGRSWRRRTSAGQGTGEQHPEPGDQHLRPARQQTRCGGRKRRRLKEADPRKDQCGQAPQQPVPVGQADSRHQGRRPRLVHPHAHWGGRQRRRPGCHCLCTRPGGRRGPRFGPAEGDLARMPGGPGPGLAAGAARSGGGHGGRQREDRPGGRHHPGAHLRLGGDHRRHHGAAGQAAADRSGGRLRPDGHHLVDATGLVIYFLTAKAVLGICPTPGEGSQAPRTTRSRRCVP